MSYKILFWLGLILALGAFVAQYYENKADSFRRTEFGPWILFGGGMLMIFLGWLVYMTNNRNNKNKTPR